MENASKALLIAGAVLIAIILISLAVVLLNNSGGATDSAKNTADVIDRTSSKSIDSINVSVSAIQRTENSTGSDLSNMQIRISKSRAWIDDVGTTYIELKIEGGKAPYTIENSERELFYLVSENVLEGALYQTWYTPGGPSTFPTNFIAVDSEGNESNVLTLSPSDVGW